MKNKIKDSNNSRRKFIKQSVLGATALGFSASSYARIIGANERVNFAVIGVNGRGKAHIMAVNPLKNASVSAFCDVDRRTFAKAQELLGEGNPKAKEYKDFRKVLDDKNVDAISIATPEHWHAPMGIMAMQAGKDVYGEKPCSFNAEEGEWLVKVQKETDRIFQMGNQQRSAPTSHEAMEDIKAGIIGKAYKGKAWYSNTRGPIGIGKKAAVPEWLDWELWQGPAPRTDFKDNYVHYNWHWFWRWGTGEINNNALHELDICRWALGVDYPTRVSSTGGRFHYDDDWEFWDTQNASFEYGDDKLITWEGMSCNGMRRHDRGRGATIHGTEGTILLDRNNYIVYDLKNNMIKHVKERTQSATTNTLGAGGLDVYHMNNFVEAIRKGVKLYSPIEEAHKSNLMCHLGNIAQKKKRSLTIDPKNGRILNDADAMKMWGREYEDGWKPTV